MPGDHLHPPGRRGDARAAACAARPGRGAASRSTPSTRSGLPSCASTPHAAGLTPGFRVADEAERAAVLRRALERLGAPGAAACSARSRRPSAARPAERRDRGGADAYRAGDGASELDRLRRSGRAARCGCSRTTPRSRRAIASASASISVDEYQDVDARQYGCCAAAPRRTATSAPSAIRIRRSTASAAPTPRCFVRFAQRLSRARRRSGSRATTARRHRSWPLRRRSSLARRGEPLAGDRARAGASASPSTRRRRERAEAEFVVQHDRAG